MQTFSKVQRLQAGKFFNERTRLGSETFNKFNCYFTDKSQLQVPDE